MKKLILPGVLFFAALLSVENVSAQKLKDKLKEATGKDNKEENLKNYDRERDLAKIGGPFADKGMTSDLHTKYVGKIVFSKDKIPMEGANESSFQSSFDLSDHIYGRVYMPQSVENYPTYQVQYMAKGDTSQPNHNDYGLLFYKLYIDNELSTWPIDVVNLSKFNLVNTTTYQVWIHPKAEDKTVSDSWKDIMNDLSPGEHTIRVECIPGSNSNYESPIPVAAGEFKLIKGSGASFSTDYGKTFDDIEARMSNPELEKKMLESIRRYAQLNSYKEDFQAVKIGEPDWRIVHHELTGAILRRLIDVYCYAQWPDGHCSVQVFEFGQEYTGGGKYTESVNCRGVVNGGYRANLNCK